MDQPRIRITFEIKASPSRSKGWARYNAPAAGIRSSTGNTWVSADHTGQAAPGALFNVEIEVELNVGKGLRHRTERSLENFLLLAEDGATCDLKHFPGSQGMKLRVTGAKRVPPRV